MRDTQRGVNASPVFVCAKFTPHRHNFASYTTSPFPPTPSLLHSLEVVFSPLLTHVVHPAPSSHETPPFLFLFLSSSAFQTPTGSIQENEELPQVLQFAVPSSQRVRTFPPHLLNQETIFILDWAKRQCQVHESETSIIPCKEAAPCGIRHHNQPMAADAVSGQLTSERSPCVSLSALFTWWSRVRGFDHGDCPKVVIVLVCDECLAISVTVMPAVETRSTLVSSQSRCKTNLARVRYSVLLLLGCQSMSDKLDVFTASLLTGVKGDRGDWKHESGGWN
ncbi:unnamed protein product [Hydatigera taeniaeformis]|uniref:Uncharacterized protein n=1 Tax=Hydatigena taeniaeformis TaxID=6205 RepID=A0A0R3WJT9_HYDTA|nr:unnamed protein product [Hydatigera taeniaeformis]